MLDITFKPSWDADILATLQLMVNVDFQAPLDNTDTLKKPIITWHDLQSAPEENDSTITDFERDDSKKTTSIARHVIEKILHYYDDTDCLFGLFSALNTTTKQLSPFIATHSYCVNVQDCTAAGTISCNISPIYLLGPEYPEQYKLQHGTALDEKAIIGLIDIPVAEMPGSDHHTFALGIDAGIVFKDSNIPHSRQLKIELQLTDGGVMANLSCKDQMMTRRFQWEELGIELKPRLAKRLAEKFG